MLWSRTTRKTQSPRSPLLSFHSRCYSMNHYWVSMSARIDNTNDQSIEVDRGTSYPWRSSNLHRYRMRQLSEQQDRYPRTESSSGSFWQDRSYVEHRSGGSTRCNQQHRRLHVPSESSPIARSAYRYSRRDQPSRRQE